MGFFIGPAELCHQCTLVQLMRQGKFELLAGYRMVYPYLAFWVENVTLIIAPIKEFLVNILPYLVTIYNPDSKAIFITPAITVNPIDLFMVAAGGKQEYQQENQNVYFFHGPGFFMLKVKHSL